MATILKKSFVHEVLKELTVAQIGALEEYVNGVGLPSSKTALTLEKYQANTLSSSNIGVTYARITLNASQHLILDGFLCYIDAQHCGFFVYYGERVENMSSIKIDPVNLTYEFMDEGLDIEEFRREIYDILDTKSGAVAKDTAKIHRFDDDDVLTEAIYADIKAGDIILVNQMSFIVAKPNVTPHTLRGSFTFGADGEITANQLDWVVGSALSITPITPTSGTKLYKHNFSLGGYDFTIISATLTAYTNLHDIYEDVSAKAFTMYAATQYKVYPFYLLIGDFIEIFDEVEHGFHPEILSWETTFVDAVTEL